MDIGNYVLLEHQGFQQDMGNCCHGLMGLAVSPLPAAIVVPPRQMVPPKMIGYNQL